MKTSCPLNAGHREIKLESLQKLPLYLLALIVAKGSIQDARGEKSSVVLPRCEGCELQYQLARQKVPTDAIVAQIVG